MDWLSVRCKETGCLKRRPVCRNAAIIFCPAGLRIPPPARGSEVIAAVIFSNRRRAEAFTPLPSVCGGRGVRILACRVAIPGDISIFKSESEPGRINSWRRCESVGLRLPQVLVRVPREAPALALPHATLP